MASIEDYKRQQDALNLYSQQQGAAKKLASPLAPTTPLPQAQTIDRFGTPQRMSVDDTLKLRNQSAAYVAGAQARAAQNPTQAMTQQVPTPAAPAKPAAAPVGQQPIAMPAGSAGWEAELTRMNNPGADVREPGQGAFWKDVRSALMYNSDVAAEQAKANPPAVKPPAAQAMANYSNEGRNFTNPIVAAATTQAKPQAMHQPEAPAAEAPQARQVAPGIFRSGNSYGDSAEAAISGPRGSGQPSARNMAAADALASRYAGPGMTQPSGLAQQAQQQGPSAYIPKDTGGYGLLDKGYRDRRAAMMDAQQMKPGARTALAALLKEQSAQGDREAQAEQNAADRGFRQGENALDRGLKSQELMARMDDSAATRQLRAQELQDNMATNAVKRDAAGVEVTSAKQMADLRSQYLNAKTDAERNDAARKLQALSGKADTSLKDNFMVVGGGQEWDANAMAMRNVPQQLIDLRTGRPVTSGQQGQAQLPPGMVKQIGTSGGKPVYEDANGKRFVGG